MIALRIAPSNDANVELAWLSADRFVLWRQGGAVGMRVDAGHADAVRQALAWHGVRATPIDGDVPPPPRLFAAVGTGLRPARLAASPELDVIEVRVVPLGEATARVTRRPVRGLPLGRRSRARCRALLRGSDALLEVRRSAWCSRATLAASRHSLRPVLFDRTAVPRPLRIFAADGHLTRWIEG